jgi:Nickel responsive protein SCO4226-like
VYVRDLDEGVVAVPIFLIERRFAEDLEGSAEVNDRINRINAEEGVRWLYSFLAADKRKTYCLYEAPDADSIRRAAARAGLPADAVVEVIDRLLPDGSLAGSPVG